MDGQDPIPINLSLPKTLLTSAIGQQTDALVREARSEMAVTLQTLKAEVKAAEADIKFSAATTLNELANQIGSIRREAEKKLTWVLPVGILLTIVLTLVFWYPIWQEARSISGDTSAARAELDQINEDIQTNKDLLLGIGAKRLELEGQIKLLEQGIPEPTKLESRVKKLEDRITILEGRLKKLEEPQADSSGTRPRGRA